MPTQQFIRACSLVVGSTGGQGLDLSTLRIQFHVEHAVAGQTPKMLAARIYNVSPQTAARVDREFTRVFLSAGYDGNADVIFDGTIRQTRYGRTNPVDTFLDIYATCNDAASTFAVSSQVLAAGWQHADVQAAAVQHMNDAEAKYVAADAVGVQAGLMPDIPGSGCRPKILYGMTRDVCRTTAESTGSYYNIQDDKLHFVSEADMRKKASDDETAIVLSPDTGLVGIPVQTQDGIQVTALINPRIQIGSLLKLESQQILGAQADLSYAGLNGGNLVSSGASDESRLSVLGISPTGTYRVACVDFEGDTRGDPWYATAVCLAVDVSTVQTAKTLLAD